MPSKSAGQYRRGTRYSVSYPNLPSLVKKPAHVELRQNQYGHDVLIMKFLMSSDYWTSVLKTGEPVKFSWTNDKSTHEWYGYVNFVTQEYASQRQQEMEVHCVGSTFPMKNRIARTFTNKTIPEIAGILASENGFRFIGKNHPRRFETIQIANQSYWEWLVINAKKIGYGIVIKGMDLYYKPLDDLIDQSMQDVPFLVSYGTQLPTNSMLMDRTLNYLKVYSGDYLENNQHKRSSKLVGGVNPFTGKAFTVSSTPANTGVSLRSELSDVLFSENHSEQVSNDAFSANLLAEGLANLARFSIPAKIRCQGDSRIRPFSPVYVQGTSPMTDGYWLVKEVIHRFALIGDYEIEMTVLSDGFGKVNETEVRKDFSGVIGTIDVEQVLANRQPITTASDVVLDNKGNLYKEIGHGFLRTPARWKALNIEPLGV